MAGSGSRSFYHKLLAFFGLPPTVFSVFHNLLEAATGAVVVRSGTRFAGGENHIVVEGFRLGPNGMEPILRTRQGNPATIEYFEETVFLSEVFGELLLGSMIILIISLAFATLIYIARSALSSNPPGPQTRIGAPYYILLGILMIGTFGFDEIWQFAVFDAAGISPN